MRRVSARFVFTCLASSLLTSAWPVRAGQEIESGPPPEREGMFGDWGGLRPKLDDRGVYLSGDYVAEVIGNPVGGRRRGAAFEGSLDLSLELNLEDLIGWHGATIAASATYPHGEHYSARHIGDLGGVTTLDSPAGIRLLELWFEQKVTIGPAEVSLRIGAQALDAEFWLSEREGVLINSTFSVPGALSGDFPIPSYAFAALGARLAAVFGRPSERAAILQIGVFDGNPASGVLPDPTPGSPASTDFNKHGTDWALRGSEGALVIGEAGFVFNQPAEATEPDEEDEEDGKSAKKPAVATGPRGLGGAWRIGFIHHTDRFADVYDSRLIASGVDIGRDLARSVPGNSALYLTVEQELWREPGSDDEGLAFFGRAAFASKQQSPFDYSWEAGLHYLGLIPGRPKDQLALGFGFTHVNSRVSEATRRANRELGRATAPQAARDVKEARRELAALEPDPKDPKQSQEDLADAVANLREALDYEREAQRDDELNRRARTAVPDYEAVLELTYRAQINRWLSVQPDVQWIVHPGGSSAIDDALVLGLRAAITF